MGLEMDNVTGKPTRVYSDQEKRAKETQRRAALRQAIWECHQDMTMERLQEFCEGVFAEIESDLP